MRTELGYRAQMGVMTPATNTTVEPELYRMGPAGVTFHFARISVAGGPREDSQGPIPAMLETPLRDLAAMEPDHILLGMSAPSFAGGVEGDRRLRAAIEQRMGTPVTTSGEAALAALQACKVRRIGVLSPYAASMDEQTTDFFSGRGVRGGAVPEAGTRQPGLHRGQVQGGIPDQPIGIDMLGWRPYSFGGRGGSTGRPPHMSTSSVPRRNVLKLGAVVIANSLFATMSQVSNHDLTPAPALAGPPDQVPTPALALTQGVWLWQHTAYANDQTVVCADPRKYTLAFLDSGLYGVQADCNHGSGSYAVAGTQLTFQPGPMTRAACPPGSQDTVFLQDLGQVAMYVFDGENLVLNLWLDSGNMVFSPQPAVSLTGSAWQVLGVNNGHGAVVSVLSETQLDATFGENGIVSGTTGCNTYRGLYTVAGPTIALGPLISSHQACPSEAAAVQEQAFLAALGASTRYELRDDRLTLRSDAGATQVDLVRPMG